MKKLLAYLLLPLAVSACVYPYQVDLAQDVENTLVIEGNILLGTTSSVRLSQIVRLDADQRTERPTITNATVSLECENGTRYNAVQNGDHFSVNTWGAPESAQYRLTVQYDGQEFQSEWVAPIAPPTVTSVEFDADDRNVNVYLSMQKSPEGLGYAAITFEEIWQFHTEYLQQYYYDPETNVVDMLMNPNDAYYWCYQKSVNQQSVILDYEATGGVVNHYLFHSFPRTANRNHKEYKIMAIVREIGADEYRYLKTLQDNSEGGADIFTPEPGQAQGNFSCITDNHTKVYGRLSVFRAGSDIGTLDSRYYLYGTRSSLVAPEPDYYLNYYNIGYRPIDMIFDAELGQVVGWGPARCYNCVAAGGTLDQPEFGQVMPGYAMGD